MAMNSPSGEQALKRDSGRRTAGPGPLSMFFREFLRHPVMVGSIIPSSGKLIDKMLSRTDWANTKLFVEYGPGVGTFSQAILDRMTPEATYLAIDTDVRRIIADHGHENADYILSGLPFSTLPPGIGPRIAAETQAALRPGGAFLVYQFSPKVKDFLVPHFERIDHDYELINIPPAQLYWAWKD